MSDSQTDRPAQKPVEYCTAARAAELNLDNSNARFVVGEIEVNILAADNRCRSEKHSFGVPGRGLDSDPLQVSKSSKSFLPAGRENWKSWPKGGEQLKKERRQFLKSAAGVTAGLALACSPEAEALAATASALRGGTAAETLGPPMPTLDLGPYKVSRLIVGSNPIHGYSHFNRLFSLHMLEWSTLDNVCDLLDQCYRNGINTWQFSHHERAIRDLKEHRGRGGQMQWILLSHREIEDDHRLIQEVKELGPIGIVHHGGSAERKRREGKVSEIRDFLKAVRDSGLMVGLSTHDPEFLEQAEEEQWDVDFYMTSLYYLTRTDEEFRRLLGTRPLGEIYLPEDLSRMCQAMRETPKPCLAYKLLAAGRISSPAQVDRAFQYVFENIKPNDGVIVGMYPRFSDQVSENAARVKRIGAKLQA